MVSKQHVIYRNRLVWESSAFGNWITYRKAGGRYYMQATTKYCAICCIFECSDRSSCPFFHKWSHWFCECVQYRHVKCSDCGGLMQNPGVRPQLSARPLLDVGSTLSCAHRWGDSSHVRSFRKCAVVGIHQIDCGHWLKQQKRPSHLQEVKYWHLSSCDPSHWLKAPVFDGLGLSFSN